jgi:hypothetical protein
MSPCHHVHISYTTRYYDITYCHVPPPLSFILWLSCIITYVHMYFFGSIWVTCTIIGTKGKGWEGKGSETNWCENTYISIPPPCESFIKGVMTFSLWASSQNGTRQRKKAWHKPKTMKHNFKQMKEVYEMEWNHSQNFVHSFGQVPNLYTMKWKGWNETNALE